MAASKTPISGASSYSEIGEYWDQHDLSEIEPEAPEVQTEVDLQSSVIYFAVDKTLAARLRSAAALHGITPETLLNLWVEERVRGEVPSK
jgi:hypothetical protein